MKPRKRLNDYWTDSLQDVRYTFRTLGRDPGFAAVSILILASGHRSEHRGLQRGKHIAVASASFPDSPRVGMDRTAAERLRPILRDILFRRVRRIPCAELRLSGRHRILRLQHSRHPALRDAVNPNRPPVSRSLAISFRFSGSSLAMGRLFTTHEAHGGPHPVALSRQRLLAPPVQFRSSHGGKSVELNGYARHRLSEFLPDSFDFGAVFSPGAKVDLFTPLSLDQARDWGNIVDAHWPPQAGRDGSPRLSTMRIEWHPISIST